MNGKVVNYAMTAAVCMAVLGTGCGRKKQEAEQATRAMEQLAEQAAAAAEAAKAAQKAAAGEARLADFRDLKALLPETVAELKRSHLSGERSGVSGMSVSVAEARYENEGGASLQLRITDMGGLGGLAAMAQLGWASVEVDRETDTGYEKTISFQGHKGYEEYNKEEKSGALHLLVGKRFLIDISGHGVETKTLKTALESLALAKLQKLGE